MANSPLLWFGNAAKFLKSQLVIPGSTSGALTVQPAAATTDYTLTMPATQGGASSVLTNDGSGALSWGTGGGATVTGTLSNLTFTTSGFGTPLSFQVFYQRIADRMYVQGFFLAGTVSANIAAIILPSSHTVDFTKAVTTTNSGHVGTYAGMDTSAANASIGSNNVGGHVFVDGSTTDRVFLTISTASSKYSKVNGNGIWNTGAGLSFRFDVPITEWA